MIRRAALIGAIAVALAGCGDGRPAWDRAAKRHCETFGKPQSYAPLDGNGGYEGIVRRSKAAIDKLAAVPLPEGKRRRDARLFVMTLTSAAPARSVLRPRASDSTTAPPRPSRGDARTMSLIAGPRAHLGTRSPAAL